MVVIEAQLGLFHLNINPDDTSNIRTYVGSDGKIHFVDRTGADSVLNFSKDEIKYEEKTMTKDAPKNGATQSFTFTSSLSSVLYAGIKLLQHKI